MTSYIISFSAALRVARCKKKRHSISDRAIGRCDDKQYSNTQNTTKKRRGCVGKSSVINCRLSIKVPAPELHTFMSRLKPTHYNTENPNFSQNFNILLTVHLNIVLSQSVHRTATYRCDDTRDCIV